MSNVHSFEKQGPERTPQQEKTGRNPDRSTYLTFIGEKTFFFKSFWEHLYQEFNAPSIYYLIQKHRVSSLICEKNREKLYK
jgi:hypothetical protein